MCSDSDGKNAKENGKFWFDKYPMLKIFRTSIFPIQAGAGAGAGAATSSFRRDDGRHRIVMAASARQRLALAVCCLGLFAASASGGGGGGGDVIALGDADFDYLATEHDTMLVKFYAPWCGHCKKLAPEFEKAAGKLKGSVQLAKVDCTAQAETCGRFGVSGYPTLKIFRNGRDWASYDGPRSAEGIFEYMSKQTGPDSLRLLSDDDLRTFVRHYDASVVGVFSGEDSSGLANFLKAAELLRDQFRFAHTTRPELAEPYGLRSEGVLLFRPPRLANPFEEGVVVLRDFGSVPSLRRFIRDNVYGLCPHMTLENKDRLRAGDLLTAFYHVDYRHNVPGSNYWRNRVMKVASGYAGRGLSFSVANLEDFRAELEAEFGVGTADGGDLPVVTIRTKAGHKFAMREEFTRDGASLGRFLEQYFARRLKRYVKSEPVPDGNAGAVQVVVAESFNAVVNQPTKDVLVLFYSPSCPRCKKLEPVYAELAETLSADADVVVAKMNAVDNDVPQGYDVRGYPTVYLAPAGTKDRPVLYQGGRELRDFLGFLRQWRRAGPSGVKQEL
ncbi:protein disulfide-isomerase A3-like isoform X2 [Corythoichthys intestinalis]|uniref:protein disulfide-isomerase A3-like isoform X2 n=1 Tax=Corythoichthys intestinalis TaxID=161448 RepID=UPI0025A607E5|nr:protein disulfide-isomerase A3-like isoform X2 [Corythoichthys intestinalis]